MKIIESKVIPPEPVDSVRRIVLELPDSRAAALANWLNGVAVWSTTKVGIELETLHRALGGFRDPE